MTTIIMDETQQEDVDIFQMTTSIQYIEVVILYTFVLL